MNLAPSPEPPHDPLERANHWMAELIWPQIHTMLLDDAFVKLLGRAQQLTGELQGPIGNLVFAGYVTGQTITIRRLCDNTKNVVSLRRLLLILKKAKALTDSKFTDLTAKLDSCKHVCAMASSYVAHRADPSRSAETPGWHLLEQHLTDARRAICEVAVIIDRDILLRINPVKILPVSQLDIMREFRLWLPPEQIKDLWDHWHTYNATVNSWIP